MRHRRTWTPTAKARILDYYQKHGRTETLKQYRLSESVLYRWVAKAKSDRHRGSAAPHVSKANGVADAIVYLQHAEGALQGKPSNAELFALLALRTLTGEITK